MLLSLPDLGSAAASRNSFDDFPSRIEQLLTRT